MKAIDEFGSVLVMAAVILGACTVVDGLFLPAAAGGARPNPAFADHAPTNFIAVVHQDRVILADQSRMRPAAADVGVTAQAASPQQARLSW